MRILAPTAKSLPSFLSQTVTADYVYMYPPRQAYRPLGDSEIEAAVNASLAREGPLNLYVHVPFCRQICAFCNLYTVAGVPETTHARYVDALKVEINHCAPFVRGRPLETIYVGGGTPSILAPQLIGEILDEVRRTGIGDPESVPEVALEVAPDTVTLEKLAAFRKVGINRVNLGAQSWVDGELAAIGRHHGAETPRLAVQAALEVGFANVCVDLIYGLEGQTDHSWAYSVQSVIALRPETICCYALTLRPITGFASRGFRDTDTDAQYRRYDLANDLLTAAGYEQETHVRWILPGRGGYRQKANHWAGHDVLGVGAGARSYLHECDVRNGYSVSRRFEPLRRYLEKVSQDGHARSDGFLMDEDERRRKDIILGLGYLDRERYRERHQIDSLELFPEEFSALQQVGAVVVNPRSVSLTARGHRHRDVLVQVFFSERVRRLIEGHDYNE